MKKSERILLSIVTMIIGVLLVVLKGKFIGLLGSVVGISLIVLGIVDVFNGVIPLSIIKITVGVFVVICGFAVARAVLYLISALLLLGGVLCLYDKLKSGLSCATLPYRICELAIPSICILMGILLLFHRIKMMNIILITCGVLSLILGGVTLLIALEKDA